jgi:hypothetical protein
MGLFEEVEDPKQRHVNLGWELIGHKLAYYYPEKIHSSWLRTLEIPDSEYDEKEKEYLRLCNQLSLPNTIAGQTQVDGLDVEGDGMTEVDLNRPAITLSLYKYGKRRFH